MSHNHYKGEVNLVITVHFEARSNECLREDYVEADAVAAITSRLTEILVHPDERMDFMLVPANDEVTAIVDLDWQVLLPVPDGSFIWVPEEDEVSR